MKWTRYLVALAVGIIIGCAICMGIGIYLNYYDPYTMIKGHPKKFGDIKIIPRQSNDVKSLELVKNDNIFFYAEADNKGKVTDIAIARKKNDVILTLKYSEIYEQWMSAIYGGGSARSDVKEMYIDINFDGQFDIKTVDNKGEITRYAYINNVWQEYKPTEGRKTIKCNQKQYEFDIKKGMWTAENANTDKG